MHIAEYKNIISDFVSMHIAEYKNIISDLRQEISSLKDKLNSKFDENGDISLNFNDFDFNQNNNSYSKFLFL